MSNKKMTVWVLGFVFIIVLLGLVALFWSGTFSKSYKKITVGVENSALPAAVWVAEAKGYFKKQGLQVQLKPFDSGKDSFLAMLDNKGIDISTVAPTPIMFQSFKRSDFSVLATFFESYNDVKIIARRSSGIHSALDLRGKKIGLPLGSTSQYVLSAYLKEYNLSIKDVKVIDLKPSQLKNAIMKGEVNAVVIWEPVAIKILQALGSNGIQLPTNNVYLETFNFVSMNHYIKTHHEAIVGFLKAIKQANIFIENHESQSQAIVAERLQLNRKIVNAIWHDFTFTLSMKSSLIETLIDEAKWAIESKLVSSEKVPNYLNYMYVDAIKKLSPHFVTIDNVKNVVTQKVTKTLSKKDRVVISVGSQPIGALVYIALMNGYFAENGLDVVLKKYLTGKSALDAAINGESDLATTADTPIVFSVLGGTKLNIVATIGTSNRNIAIIASSKNKAISNIESLRGKRVGVTFGTNGQYFLDKMLVKHGLSTSDITAVDVRPADMLQALSSGKVDAVATWYPHRLTIQNQLPDVLEFSNRTVYTWYWNLVGRSAYVLTHKKLINRILKSLLQAQNFIEHNPILARHKVLEYLKISAKNDSKLWDVADYGLELSPGLISTLKEQAKWAVRLRLVPNQKIPNFKEAIYWQGLREVSPDSVKVY